ncbi:hypothetical protein HDU76_009016, partial [Blyttiomyces sp. JEL0837]
MTSGLWDEVYLVSSCRPDPPDVKNAQAANGAMTSWDIQCMAINEYLRVMTSTRLPGQYLKGGLQVVTINNVEPILGLENGLPTELIQMLKTRDPNMSPSHARVLGLKNRLKAVFDNVIRLRVPTGKEGVYGSRLKVILLMHDDLNPIDFTKNPFLCREANIIFDFRQMIVDAVSEGAKANKLKDLRCMGIDVIRTFAREQPQELRPVLNFK